MPSTRLRTTSFLLVRLEVDVAGPLPDRPEKDAWTNRMTGASSGDSRRSRVSSMAAVGSRSHSPEGPPRSRSPGVRPLVRGVDPGEHLVLRRADDPGRSGEEPHLVDRLAGLRLPPTGGRCPRPRSGTGAGGASVRSRSYLREQRRLRWSSPGRTGRATRGRSRPLSPCRFGEHAHRFAERALHLVLPVAAKGSSNFRCRSSRGFESAPGSWMIEGVSMIRRFVFFFCSDVYRKRYPRRGMSPRRGSWTRSWRNCPG